MKETILNILKTLWQLPVGILVWSLYILPLWATKQIKYIGKATPLVLEFELSDKDTVYTDLWKGWMGNSLPFALIRVSINRMRKRYPGIPLKTIKKEIRILRLHELHHNKQHESHGPFFYLRYGAHSLWIKISNLWRDKNRDWYWDNPMEIAAVEASEEG